MIVCVYHFDESCCGFDSLFYIYLNPRLLQIPETIIALIDPDFIFLKPLTPYLSPKESVVRGDGLSIEGLKLENGDWVHKGHPAGAVNDLHFGQIKPWNMVGSWARVSVHTGFCFIADAPGMRLLKTGSETLRECRPHRRLGAIVRVLGLCSCSQVWVCTCNVGYDEEIHGPGVGFSSETRQLACS